MNVRRILEALRENGPCSRADLTRLSGISAPTVSKVVQSLLETGLIEEGDMPRSTVGRPGRHLRLASGAMRVVGVELDARRWRLSVAGFDGKETGPAPREFPIPERYDQLVADLVANIAPLQSSRQSQLLGVGISTPGLIDSRADRVELSPNLRILDGQRVGADLGDRLGVPCVMQQEANAQCIAERVFGDAVGLDDFALLDLSTGLGLGVVTNGELVTGSQGYAGELGHILYDQSEAARECGCTKRGCLETRATATALCASIEERGGGHVTIDEAIRRVREGDVIAAAALAETAEHLAVAMSYVINLLNPRALFLYSHLFDARDDLFDRVTARARALALGPPGEVCEFRRARSTKLQGAIAVILRHLTEEQGPLVP